MNFIVNTDLQVSLNSGMQTIVATTVITISDIDLREGSCGVYISSTFVTNSTLDKIEAAVRLGVLTAV